MTPTPETVQNYRAAASVCMRNALDLENSLGTRASAAFNAVYSYCCIVEPEFATGEDMLAIRLVAAGKKLGWPRADMQPALNHLKNWYSSEATVQGVEYDKLVALAWRLEAITAPGQSGQFTATEKRNEDAR